MQGPQHGPCIFLCLQSSLQVLVDAGHLLAILVVLLEVGLSQGIQVGIPLSLSLLFLLGQAPHLLLRFPGRVQALLYDAHQTVGSLVRREVFRFPRSFSLLSHRHTVVGGEFDIHLFLLAGPRWRQ